MQPGGDDDAPDDEQTTRERVRRPSDAPTEGGDGRPAPAVGSRALPAELLAGRYRLVGELGRGGMGEVFVALDTKKNDLRVALKQMFATDPRSVARLKREYRRMEGIAHPHLVTLHGLEEHRGRPFIVMEYVDGTDFYAALRRAEGAPVDEDRLRALVRPLAHGVMALHDAGRVHRDLKGKNVMVSAQGRVVVLDFGLVDEFERRTLLTSTMGKAAGTPYYMAPEQAAGQFSTPASDWYALGVMLYVAATGRYPIDGSHVQVLFSKQSAEVPRARSIDPRVSPGLDELIARLLQREPLQRAGGHDVLAWCERAPRPPRRAGPPLAAPPALLVGRKPQLEALAGALSRSSRELVRVELSGPSGTGKSALLRNFLAPLRRDPNVVVLAGKCHEYDHVPLKAFDPLIEDLGRHLSRLPREQQEPLLDAGFRALARLFPALRRVHDTSGAEALLERLGLHGEASGEQELRERASRGLRGLLHRLAAGSRVVLAVDDLQWADLDSARLLRELAADPAPPLLLILAYRDEASAGSPVLRELVGDDTTSARRRRVVVRTEALPREQAIELAQRLLGAAPRARAERVADEAQGNPMLIEAIVRYLGDAAGAAETAGRRLSVEALVSERLATQGPEASRMLTAIAATGQPEALETIARAADITGDPRAPVAQLRASHLIRTADADGATRVECYHQRIAKAALGRLAPQELAAVHRRVAEALVAAGCEELDRLAYHWFAAGDRDRAGEVAAEAALLAFQTCSFDRAAHLYRLAQACQPQDASLTTRLAGALAAAGRVAEAAPLLLAAAESASPRSARSLRLRAAELWMSAGELTHGLAVLRPLLADHAIAYPEQEIQATQQLAVQLAGLTRRGLGFSERSPMELSGRDLERCDLHWILCKGHAFGDAVRSGLFAAQSAALALDLGEPRRIARALALAGVVALERGEAAGGAWLKEAETVAHKIRDDYTAGFVALCWGLVHCGAGEWARAVEDLEFGLSRMPAGTAWEHSLASASLLSSLDSLGELTTLADRSGRLSRLARDLGSWRIECLGLAYAGLAALAADDVARCRALLREVSARLGRESFQIVHLHALKVAVDCDLYAGDPVGAWRRISAEWPAIEASPVLRTRLRRMMAIALRARAGLALCAGGAPGYDHVAEIVAQDVAQIEREQAPTARAASALLRAGLQAQVGQVHEVRRWLVVAVADFDALGMALHATCARRCRALWGATPEERALRESAEGFMRLQGAARPDRWTAVLAPGLGRDE